jgi:hypothetical protein
MPKVTQNIDNLMISINVEESTAALNALGAYTIDYSPLAYPIVFFLSVTNTTTMQSIVTLNFPTLAVIGILNATAGLDSGPALEFYQLINQIDLDTSDPYNIPVNVEPNDYSENGNRIWKKIELAY